MREDSNSLHKESDLTAGGVGGGPLLRRVSAILLLRPDSQLAQGKPALHSPPLTSLAPPSLGLHAPASYLSPSADICCFFPASMSLSVDHPFPLLVLEAEDSGHWGRGTPQTWIVLSSSPWPPLWFKNVQGTQQPTKADAGTQGRGPALPAGIAGGRCLSFGDAQMRQRSAGGTPASQRLLSPWV